MATRQRRKSRDESWLAEIPIIETPRKRRNPKRFLSVGRPLKCETEPQRKIFVCYDDLYKLLLNNQFEFADDSDSSDKNYKPNSSRAYSSDDDSDGSSVVTDSLPDNSDDFDSD